MKKLLATVLSIMAAIMLLTLVSVAETVFFEDDYVAEGDFVVAMINGTKPFFADAANPEPVEDACYWLGDYASKYNIKYVSFLGRMSSGTNYPWSYATANGLTDKELYDMNVQDKEWTRDFDSLKMCASLLSDMEVPYGVSIGLYDYVANGMDRANIMQNIFTVEEMVSASGNKYYEMNVNNFAMIATVGDVDYIIYQLEAYPNATTISWFHSMQAQHQDKRAIVFTTSFLDKTGDMYTQHDWSMSTTEWLQVYRTYNTTITSNMLNYDKPHEGNQLFKDAFADWDNIIFIGSGNAQPGKNIVTTTLKSNNGYPIAAAVTSLEGGYASQNFAYPVLVKISADNKTLDLRYAVPYYGPDKTGGYVEESKVVIELSKLAPLKEADPYTKLDKVSPQANGANVAYINGYEDGSFKPNANMTKAEAAKIFASLLAETQDLPGGLTTRFTDVKEDDWFYKAVSYLDSKNYYYTTEGETFNPNAPITRAEFVELAYFATELSTAKSMKFTDVPKDHKYYTAITAASAAGLVNGYEDGSFKPDATITRAEVVTVVNRLVALIANEKMVSKTRVDNHFNDIDGHWAEYQIIMASNNNVRGDYYYEVDQTVLTQTSTAISFETDYVKIELARKGAKINSIINKMTGEDINKPSNSAPWFTWIIGANGTVIQANKLSVVNGLLEVTYKNGMTLYFIIETFPTYFTIALDTNLPKTVDGLAFGNFAVNSFWELNNENAYGFSGVSMTTKVDNNGYTPGGYSKATRALAYTYLGVPTLGSKMGFAFSRMTEHREHLKDIVDVIDPNEGVTSTHGGPYAYDQTDIYKDYIIQSGGLNPDNAEETAKICAEYSVGQFDFHQGASSFTTAEFNFVSARTAKEVNSGTFITAEVFKERIVDKFTAEGVIMGLHTYSSLVPSSATTILSNPKWQQQLSFAPETYTLRGRLTRFKTNIKTNEDASTFQYVANTAIPWNNIHTLFILIDEEIIRVQQGTSSGFLNVKRGQLGTKAAVHEDGAEIRQLIGWYGMFQPQPLSELFYHIAENTAKAYNEGGFGMIYLDGLESFARDGLSEPRMRDYIYAEFIRTVVSNCEVKPLIEGSAFPHAFWAARARGGATDCARRSYKNHKKGHVNSQRTYLRYFYTATLGWFNFNPDGGQEFKDTIARTMYRDDLDYVGTYGVIFNFSTVNDDFSLEDMKGTSRMPANFYYYGLYTKLREGNYFAQEVKDEILAGMDSGKEYRIMKQEDGSWAFNEMKYFKQKVFDMTLPAFATGKGTNSFGEQTPFIRIEQRYSSPADAEEVVVYEFDEAKPVTEYKGTHNIELLDIKGKTAFKIRVLGNGSETDAILITLRAVTTAETGRHDMFIPLNFTGWREFILCEVNNDDYPGFTFSGISTGGVNYETYRAIINFDMVNRVQITLAGSCQGVMIDDLRATVPVDAPVKNPSITIGGQTMTFNTELHSGEYIEYYPEWNKAYLNYYVNHYNEETGKFAGSDAHVKEISYTGSVTVPAGSFTYTYSAEPMTEMTTRAQTVIGLYGDVVANPEGWVAPEVEVPEDMDKIRLY